MGDLSSISLPQIPEPAIYIGAVLLVSLLLLKITAWLKGVGPLPYESAGSLLTATELRFHVVLEQALPAGLKICPKVRLADVVKVQSRIGRRAWGQAFNQIKSKHLDFVLCDATTLAIRMAIELDDRSHEAPENAARDQKKDAVLLRAGIPLLRFKTARAYSAQELRASILERLRTRS